MSMYTILFSLPLPLPKKKIAPQQNHFYDSTPKLIPPNRNRDVGSRFLRPSPPHRTNLRLGCRFLFHILKWEMVGMICDVVWGTPLKTNMTIKWQAFEDVCPSETGDFRGYVSYQEGKYFWGDDGDVGNPKHYLEKLDSFWEMWWKPWKTWREGLDASFGRVRHILRRYLSIRVIAPNQKSAKNLYILTINLRYLRWASANLGSKEAANLVLEGFCEPCFLLRMCFLFGGRITGW